VQNKREKNRMIVSRKNNKQKENEYLHVTNWSKHNGCTKDTTLNNVGKQIYVQKKNEQTN
jgi:hypothetical protein